MPQHVVKAGECLANIAQQYGFADWRTLYSHAQNAALREKRPNPNLLFPGDVVFIPERQAKSAKAQTGKTHRFIIKRQASKLILVLQAKGEPLANRACEVEADNRLESLTTDGDGRLEVPLHPATTSVKLTVEGLDEELLLQVGHLDPVTELSGVQGRLLALGFYLGRVDGKAGPATRRSLRDFQRASGLAASGEPDPDTQRALEKAFGG
ncbi:MAG: peptidoglycan-binding protein [Myxococcaceae bacterium]|nr:peptidoglycan-binding protein [Myxococcaceae bacterium]